jgi:dihydroorotate dehydrogenase
MGAVGLAAGFDADGDLTAWCPFMGFGFHSVGTVTVKECRGNRPLSATLGRAVRSRSLYVWKGLRNRGLPTLLNRLASHPEDSTVRGVSVGPTNEPSCAGPDAQIESVLAALRVLRDGPADAVSFVELNISCPNLSGENCLQRPAVAARLIREAHEEGLLWEGATWVKFPLLTDEGEALELMEALVNAVPDAVTGLVVANLYRDRVSPVLDPVEVAALPGAGKFSGAPCAEPSNNLIRLARKHFGPRLRLVGCGGIFTAEDAYKKIRLGAESVQIASALVFDGPLVPLDLDRGLAACLAADGFATLADAVGVDVDE